MSAGKEREQYRRDLQRLLEHGAADPSVQNETIERQLKTAAALRVRLNTRGGAILGDEVGAGKTYVAMALIAHALSDNPRKGAVVLVPKPALLAKWKNDLTLYFQSAVRDKRLRKRLVDSISVLDRDLSPQKRNAIAIGQQNLFMGKLSDYDCATVLRTYLRKRSGRSRFQYKPWLRACGITGDAAEYEYEYEYLRWATPEVLDDAEPGLLEPLDPFFEQYDNREHVDPDRARAAIAEIRRRVARKHLPDAALLVIDEAHHLRHTTTTRYWTMLEVLEQRFDALLFLTATPFQMGPDELKNVVEFSRSARFADTSSGGESAFDAELARMVSAMDDHVRALAAFGRAWADLDTSEAASARLVVARILRSDEAAPHVADTASLFERAKETKVAVEDAMRPFVIRSVRTHYRQQRSGLIEGVDIEPASRIPLALVDRMLYEVFEQGERTFIASVLLGACSSWEALAASAVMETQPAGTATRAQLKSLFGHFGSHPKVEATVQATLSAVSRGEKVLIFVGRVESGRRALRDRLENELQREDESSATKERGRRVLQDRDRLGWPALRENYLHTVFPMVFGKEPSRARLQEVGQRHAALFRHVDSEAPKSGRDYSLEKRFWEHILFSEAAERRPKWEQDVDGEELAHTTRRILDPDYILNGLDLQFGDSGRPRRAGSNAESKRSPQMDFAQAFLTYRSPWYPYRDTLARISPDQRASFVDQVASAIARSQLRFDFLALDFEGKASTLFRNMTSLLGREEWAFRFKSLADQLEAATRQEPEAVDQGEASAERIARLMDGLRSTNRVQYVDAGTDPITRDRAVQGFKTPMYPDVLIATDALGEGIDLHRHCRHVIHHDLPWNPATLEQRTGRVDRIGSFSEYLRERGVPRAGSDIVVDLPYVPGTYDAFIYSRVTARERVFRWLLGYRPEWDQETVTADEPPPPVPEGWAEELRIDLSPH